MKPLLVVVLSTAAALLTATPAWGYGYSRDEDPLLLAFRAAIKASRSGDRVGARREAERVRWQIGELKTKSDLGCDFGAAFSAAHADGASHRDVVYAWSNLLYLALRQKFHWNQREKLADYHKARARLDSAVAYYELALAGNVRRQDAARKQRDPKARSRHADITAQFTAAKKALGSPGLFGTGKRAPDPKAFLAATRRILGHLKASFPAFKRPAPRKAAGTKGS